MHKVAVYGTLKKGHGNHRLLQDAVFLGVDALEGYNLYDLGSFPGVQPGEGSVQVEVYEVSDAVFDRLDMLEGYDAAYPEHSLYLREQTHTVFGDTWIYTFNGPIRDTYLMTGGVWPEEESVESYH